MKRALFLAKEAALRWTGACIFVRDRQISSDVGSLSDNYGALLAYFTRQNGADPAAIRNYLDIDEEYEDIC